jgi:hypothetical protein
VDHYQVWIKWTNTLEWQMVKAFPSAWLARDYVQNSVSVSGGRVARIELRERTADTGEALFDVSWGRLLPSNWR